MTDVIVETVIGRPKADVAAYMFEPGNDVAWTTGITDARPLTPGRLRVGSRVVRSARFAGRKFDYEYRVTEARGDDMVELQVEKPFPMKVVTSSNRSATRHRSGSMRVAILACSFDWRARCYSP
jgi:hypothetical protein